MYARAVKLRIPIRRTKFEERGCLHVNPFFSLKIHSLLRKESHGAPYENMQKNTEEIFMVRS